MNIHHLGVQHTHTDIKGERFGWRADALHFGSVLGRDPPLTAPLLGRCFP